MEALCVGALPIYATQGGAAVPREVKGFGRQKHSVARAGLACRSSSYLLGGTDLRTFKVKHKRVRAVVSRGARCETTEGGSNTKVDVWIGRLAMIGFVAAIGTEISSGKGVLANLGVSTPAPTLALALTAVIGVIVAFGVFRSAADE